MLSLSLSLLMPANVFASVSSITITKYPTAIALSSELSELNAEVLPQGSDSRMQWATTDHDIGDIVNQNGKSYFEPLNPGQTSISAVALSNSKFDIVDTIVIPDFIATFTWSRLSKPVPSREFIDVDFLTTLNQSLFQGSTTIDSVTTDSNKLIINYLSAIQKYQLIIQEPFTSTEYFTMVSNGVAKVVGVTCENYNIPQHNQNEYVRYDIGKEYGFNIRGCSDGYVTSTKQNKGYVTALQVGNNSKQKLNSFFYGKPYTYDGVTVKVTPHIRGKAIELTYTLTNTTSNKLSVKIGSSANMYISYDDRPTLKLSSNGLTLLSHNNSYAFTLSSDSHNFTTKYFGTWTSWDNVFTNSDARFDGVDVDGIGWSWSVDIPAGETVARTAYLSLSNLNLREIIFDANGGSGGVKPIVGIYDGITEAILPDNSFTREGYDFLGWSDSSADTVPDYHAGDKIKIPENDTILYAIWREIKPTIITTPKARIVKENGSEQDLVTAGEALYGTMKYALGKNTVTEPDSKWSPAIPKGRDAGKYFVWYRVDGESESTKPACVLSTILSKSSGSNIGGEEGGNTGDNEGEGENTDDEESEEKPKEDEVIYECKITTADNRVDLDIDVTVSDTKAIIGSPCILILKYIDEFESIDKPTEIIINASEIPKDITNIVIPAEVMQIIDQSVYLSSTKFVLSKGSISLDSASVKSVTEQSSGNTIDISLIELTARNLNEDQIKTVYESDGSIILAFRVNISSNSKIGSYAEGTATVVVNNITKKSSQEDDYINMLYIPHSNKIEYLPTKLKDATCTFFMNHSADYILAYTASHINGNKAKLDSAVVEDLTYNGGEQSIKISNVVAYSVFVGKCEVHASAYEIIGDAKVTDVGEYHATIKAKENSDYYGTINVTYKINKADQHLTVSTKPVKVKRGKRKVNSKKIFQIAGSVGSITFVCLEGNKNLTLKPNGTIKIQKHIKRGAYSMKVKVCAAGDENYNFATQIVNVTIQVK